MTLGVAMTLGGLTAKPEPIFVRRARGAAARESPLYQRRLMVTAVLVTRAATPAS